MRPLAILGLAAVLSGLVAQPGSAEEARQKPKAKQVAQRQIICTTAIGGCREVKPGCRVENMPSKDHDASGHQKEVCPGN
jgi:hypothetical protein